eukprot:5550084-Pyramimonas_sp.AAC.1
MSSCEYRTPRLPVELPGQRSVRGILWCPLGTAREAREAPKKDPHWDSKSGPGGPKRSQDGSKSGHAWALSRDRSRAPLGV